MCNYILRWSDVVFFYLERKVLVVLESDSASYLKVIKYFCSHGLNDVNQFTLQMKSDISKPLKMFFLCVFLNTTFVRQVSQ